MSTTRYILGCLPSQQGGHIWHGVVREDSDYTHYTYCYTEASRGHYYSVCYGGVYLQEGCRVCLYGLRTV